MSGELLDKIKSERLDERLSARNSTYELGVVFSASKQFQIVIKIRKSSIIRQTVSRSKQEFYEELKLQ